MYDVRFIVEHGHCCKCDVQSFKKVLVQGMIENFGLIVVLFANMVKRINLSYMELDGQNISMY